MLSEANSPTALLGKSITRNMVVGTAQPDQISLPTEIGGFIKFMVGIADPFRTHTENWTGPTIKPTRV